MTLVEFLRARLADDEQTAQTATSGPWKPEPCPYSRDEPEEQIDNWEVYGGAEGGTCVVAHQPHEGGGASRDDARYIARHDPKRALAEVESKRETLRLYEDTLATIEMFKSHGREAQAHEVAAESYLNVLRAHAAVYADHQDYLEEWHV